MHTIPWQTALHHSEIGTEIKSVCQLAQRVQRKFYLQFDRMRALLGTIPFVIHFNMIVQETLT
ncbi:MAG: hypothetical protein HBSIN02_25470 [Bacteroidia bacterium]|nr:MAG: hypothetical protein HBSIN02_25470 [Bacteroidia bacterium]